MPQSRRRYVIFFSPRPFAARSAAMASTAGFVSQAVVLARVDAAAARLVRVPGLPGVGRERLAVDGDHLLDRQAVFLREREVALVVRRHAHHRAVAVAHQHVVADPHLDLLAGERMRDEQAGGHALLLHRRELGFLHAAALAFLDEGRELGIRLRGVRGERMLRRHRAERDAHDRVGARREDLQPAVADRARRRVADVVREREAHALAAADPVRCICFTRSGQPGIRRASRAARRRNR